MRTNRISFTDVATLVSVMVVKDSAGYDVTTETRTDVFCSICNGVTHSEYYEALRADIKLKATLEVWEEDYNEHKFVEMNGNRYHIVRAYPSGHGTLFLTCEEVLN